MGEVGEHGEGDEVRSETDTGKTGDTRSKGSLKLVRIVKRRKTKDRRELRVSEINLGKWIRVVQDFSIKILPIDFKMLCKRFIPSQRNFE